MPAIVLMIPPVVISQMPGMPGSAINPSPKPSTAMALMFIAALVADPPSPEKSGSPVTATVQNQPSRRDLANLRAEFRRR
jgi:hypothetical protein